MTAQEIQTRIDALYALLDSPELELQDADGHRIRYKSNADIERAITRYEKRLTRATSRGMAFTLRGGKNL